jgi:hypothetical protein
MNLPPQLPCFYCRIRALFRLVQRGVGGVAATTGTLCQTIDTLNTRSRCCVLHFPPQRLSNIAENHLLPVTIRSIALALDTLQALQITKIDTVESMGPRRSPRISIRIVGWLANHGSNL